MFITQPEQLTFLNNVKLREVKAVHEKYPVRISEYYFKLMQKVGEPLIQQAVPDIRELDDPDGLEDPLDEENLSPVPNLIHKYPDRVLFLVSNECAMYCRFCTRKRKIGNNKMKITSSTIRDGIQYIKDNPGIKDVLLSGGDPLMLSDNKLAKILDSLRQVDTVETIRIGTRIPCTMPSRITPKLIKILKNYHPLYINTHFNHPGEITEQSTQACLDLADSGIPLGCQTVLLQNVNDSTEIMKELLYKLIKTRVKPYYLFQADLTEGTSHFRTTIETGQKIMRHLYKNVNGMAIPVYALDAPGGGGKIPLTPNYVNRIGNSIDFTTCSGEECSYPNYTI